MDCDVCVDDVFIDEVAVVIWLVGTVYGVLVSDVTDVVDDFIDVVPEDIADVAVSFVEEESVEDICVVCDVSVDDDDVDILEVEE